MVVAYAIGVLLTFVVVTVSAWRVSRMNIVTAIRNLPEPPRTDERRGAGSSALTGPCGGLLVAQGVGTQNAITLGFGVSLCS